MINVKLAYAAAEKLSDAKHLQQILSFDKAFGFIFSKNQNEVDIGGLCIMIDKEDSERSAFIPIIPDNIQYLRTGKEIPLSMIK